MSLMSAWSIRALFLQQETAMQSRGLNNRNKLLGYIVIRMK